MEAAEQLAALAAGRPYMTREEQKRIAARNRKRNQRLRDQNDAETLKKTKALAEKHRDAYERKTRRVNHRKLAAVGAA